jgi:hypothetical protein
MAEASFSIKGNGVLRVRLEPTDITGMGGPTYPQLIVGLKLQLLPLGQINYTLLRIGGTIYVSNENDVLATVEHPPMAEESSPQPYYRPLNLTVPLTVMQIKHIEELRGGNNLSFLLTLTGLVALKPNNEFERLQDAPLQVSIPRSHWIDAALKVWKISDLRLLEIDFPRDARKEMATARERLGRAEELYRTGDYPQVLTQLRSAFTALAECYSVKEIDRSTWEQMLIHTHASVRDKLLDSFYYFRNFLHVGPHEPLPTTQIPTPISRHDARFALIVSHAIFEYFSSENWPGI